MRVVNRRQTEPALASWRDIERIRKDPKAFRALAKRLRAHGDQLTDWEKDYLISIENQTERDEFTSRQSEKLLQIRDDYEIVTKLPRNLSVERTLAQCVEARADLLDRAEFVLKLFAESHNSIRRKDVGKLMKCAEDLYVIDKWTD